MMKRLIFIIGLFFAFGGSNVLAQTPDTLKSEGIWFRKADNAGVRFLYSQCILWPSSIAAHSYLYIKEGVPLNKAVTWKKYVRTFSLPPVWDDDHWSWNYEVHPAMGSFSYLAFRNRQAHWAQAAAAATLNSVIYEYIIAGGTQQPSYNDMIFTPVLGSLLGEGIYQAKKWMLRDKKLEWWEKIAITVSDPFEVFYFGFNYSKLAREKYR